MNLVIRQKVDGGVDWAMIRGGTTSVGVGAQIDRPVGDAKLRCGFDENMINAPLPVIVFNKLSIARCLRRFSEAVSIGERMGVVLKSDRYTPDVPNRC